MRRLQVSSFLSQKSSRVVPRGQLIAIMFYMQELSIEDLLIKVKQISQSGVWHFHYLTPQCVFNDSDKHKVILETLDGNSFALTEEMPLKQLEVMEALFYKK